MRDATTVPQCMIAGLLESPTRKCKYQVVSQVGWAEPLKPMGRARNGLGSVGLHRAGLRASRMIKLCSPC